jgi:hypothetical protein
VGGRVAVDWCLGVEEKGEKYIETWKWSGIFLIKKIYSYISLVHGWFIIPVIRFVNGGCGRST